MIEWIRLEELKGMEIEHYLTQSDTNVIGMEVTKEGALWPRGQVNN